MANVIVNSCYIRNSQHFINYLEYAGEKLEAQTLVLNSGERIDLDPDELLDVSETPDFRYIQIETKDGTIRRLGFQKYQEYVLNQTERYDEVEVKNDEEFSDEEKRQHRRAPDKYLDYIAYRPSVEHNPNLSHGLFTIDGAADMEKARRAVIENENSIKWSHIISLTREGAERTGFDNRQAWENLIRAKAYDIGKLYNIPPEHLEIYAAYHDKAHHPHCHLFFFSNANTTSEGCAGFEKNDLTRKSQKLRSIFNNQIFKDDTAYLKEEKQQLRRDLAQEVNKYVINIGKAGYTPDKEIVNAFSELSESLVEHTGRAYYSYLSPENKQKVCDFLRSAVSSDENLNQIHAKVLENQRKFISMYNDNDDIIQKKLKHFEDHFFHPNGRNDMKTLHNIIIKSAMEFNQSIASETNRCVRKEENILDKEYSIKETRVSSNASKDLEEQLANQDYSDAFNEKDVSEVNVIEEDAVNAILQNETEPFSESIKEWWSNEYKHVRYLLYGDKDHLPKPADAYKAMLTESSKGNAFAMHDLGKMLNGGIGCEKDETLAKSIFTKALEKFELVEFAKQNSYIEYRIGKMHEYGLGTEKDTSVAADWYTKAIDNGENPFAAYSLGNLYLQGSGVKQSDQKAFSYFQISASAEKNPSAYAMYKLGEMYEQGKGTDVDLKASTKWYSAAYSGFEQISKKNNDDYILYKLGYMNYKGLGTDQNYEVAIKYYLKSVEFKNTSAFYGLGKIYSNKEFDKCDLKKAIEYFKSAIENCEENDNLIAQAEYAIGKLYYTEEEIKNLEQAIKHFSNAADQGNQFAQYTLGKIYLKGNEVPKDIEKALSFLNASANQGNQFAQYTLGKLYLDGTEVPKDIEKALSFLNASANQENQFAQYALGKLYLDGTEVPKDIEKALSFLNASADQENQFAQYTLGKLYYYGRDVPKDVAKAVKYFEAAAEQGNPYAQSKLFFIRNNNQKEPYLTYGTALVLSRIAYALAGMAMQHAEQEHNNNRENKHRAKFTAKNRQIHHEPNKLNLEPVQY